jgi:hypothetical protein
MGNANALTPLPDTSPGFFAGEWAGAGERGSFCFLQLHTDGGGWVLVDGGSGDWSIAKIQWRNRQQVIQVDAVFPVPAAPRLRVMPLQHVGLSSGFNQSLTLIWNPPAGQCALQKVETTARHLKRARNALDDLLYSEGRR